MNVKEIDESGFCSLIDREESHFLDFKSRKIDGKGVQKAVVAFANSDGGEIIIGVHDKAVTNSPLERWDGFDDIEAMNGLMQAAFNIKPSPSLTYESIKSNFSKGYLLRITIEKSSEVISTSQGKVLIRHGAQSIPITDSEKLQQLAFSKGATTFEDSIIPSLPPEQITESVELSKFLNDYSPATDALEFTINQNLLEFKTWEPRVAAALLFHNMPSAVVSRKCSVKLTRYETREDDPERDHLAEQETIEGPLYDLISNTVERVTKIMSSHSVLTPKGMVTLEYPPEAIWETIVNAIIHRDYSISDDVQILVFDNRIEIKSPGKLPGYVTIENILDARFSRNPKIVRTLNRYKDAPNKDLGEGLNTTFQKMKDFGLKEPEIFEDGNYVIVRLPHTPLASPSDAIMSFLKSNDKITNKQAREMTGIRSENSMKQEFYKLRDAKLIEPVPGLKGPKSAWQKSK